MSDTKEQFLKDYKAEADLANDQQEVKKKKHAIEKKRVEQEYLETKKNEQEAALLKNTRFGYMSLNQIDRLRKENAEYMEASKNGLEFISPEFDDVVPFFRKNCIVIAAPTGQGKSTVVANLALHTISQKNPLTGKYCKALVISNEEDPGDIFNRISALVHGFSYTNHKDLTDQQRKLLDETIPILAKDGRLNVIGNNYVDDEGNMFPQLTSTIEGIRQIFDNLIANKDYYDVVMIDYYQNINTSKDNPRLDIYQCQAKFAAYLDEIKNVYPAPIVVLAQGAKVIDEDEPFDIRIKGSKILATKATVFLEMASEPEHHRTVVHVRKGRYTSATGREFHIGYKRGKYVSYTKEFQASVNDAKERQKMQQFDKLKKEEPKTQLSLVKGPEDGNSTA